MDHEFEIWLDDMRSSRWPIGIGRPSVLDVEEPYKPKTEEEMDALRKMIFGDE
jgi:hypothetical protein